MKIVKDTSAEGHDNILQYTDFEQFEDKYLENTACFYGYNTSINHIEGRHNYREQYRGYNRKIYLNGELPCTVFDRNPNIFVEHTLDRNNFFDNIYSVCPYTNEWVNKIHNREKCKPILIPCPDLNTNNDSPYFDVMYCGNIHSKEHYDIVKTITKFKYNFFTQGYQRYNNEANIIGYNTGINVPRTQMYDVLKNTKAAICINLLFLTQDNINNLRYNNSIESIDNNIAFKIVNQGGVIVPQIKTRLSEAVFSKTILIVKKDPWNVIENWFIPNEEFIYYDTIQELEDIIHNISTNYEDYRYIAENAYERASKNYNLKSLMEYMLGITPLKTIYGDII